MSKKLEVQTVSQLHKYKEVKGWHIHTSDDGEPLLVIEAIEGMKRYFVLANVIEFGYVK